MRIQAQWQLFLIALIVVCSVACHATRVPPHHGCFNPVPTPPAQQLKQGWHYQLRWPMAQSDTSLQTLTARSRRGLPLLRSEVRRVSQRQSLSAYAAALRAVRGFPSALVLNLQPETPLLATQAIETAQELGTINQIIIECTSPSLAHFLRQNYPDVAILVSTRSVDEVYEALKIVPAPEIVHLDFPWSTEDLIQSIHEAGSAVLMKTTEGGEDTPQRWKQLMDLGVDIVMTYTPETFTRSIPRACAAKRK